MDSQAQRALEAAARRALAEALAPLPGPKALLVDSALYSTRLSVVRPLDLFTDAAFLREHGVRAVTSLRAPSAEALRQPALVVVIRGVNAGAARAAVTAIRSVRAAAGPEDAEGASAPAKCLVLTTPRRSKIAEKVFRSADLADVPFGVLPLGFLPFDGDLVTLDWPDAYRQIVLEGDNSSILATAAALESLSSTLHLEFGTIRTAGAAAAAVAEELLETHGKQYARERRDGGSTASSVPSSPVTYARSTAGNQFVAPDAFSLLPGPAVPPPDLENNSNDTLQAQEEMPTLAQVVGKNRDRRQVTLVIIDRGVDMVSPMLTQWTYEGLLDEAVGLCNNVMDIPVSTLVSEDAAGMLSAGSSPGSNGSVRKRLRADVDSIFGQLRDLNYWAAARLLGSVASSVRAYYDARPGRETSEISKVKDYVKGLKEVKSEHRSAAVHTAIAAEISARTFESYEFKRRFELEREMMEGSTATGRQVYITDAVARGESLAHVLRLCCLWSMTSAGIDAEEFDFVRKEILATFGLRVLSLLCNLERAGMLARSEREQPQGGMFRIPFPSFGGGSPTPSDDGRSDAGSDSRAGSDSGSGRRNSRANVAYSWQFARAALRLVVDFDPDNTVTPGTTAAVAAPYSGYTPLTVRLVDAGLSPEGWSRLPHIVAHTALLPPGHETVEHRKHNPGGKSSDSAIEAVVVFVGGVARAEASAVRLVAQAAGVQTLIATTAVAGPDEFVLSLSDPLNI